MEHQRRIADQELGDLAIDGVVVGHQHDEALVFATVCAPVGNWRERGVRSGRGRQG